jgi:hypothetical protein
MAQAFKIFPLGFASFNSGFWSCVMQSEMIGLKNFSTGSLVPPILTPMDSSVVMTCNVFNATCSSSSPVAWKIYFITN